MREETGMKRRKEAGMSWREGGLERGNSTKGGTHMMLSGAEE